ncbi:MAG: hypothetical protein MUC87_04160 [Bacteroidia bacterium]|jgi:hypothetical protein|nr:hypothetical protein [Bacteroidia bacterium]
MKYFFIFLLLILSACIITIAAFCVHYHSDSSPTFHPEIFASAILSFGLIGAVSLVGMIYIFIKEAKS